MNQWLVVSQLAVLHLWHLHSSGCQSKHSGLSKRLCIQLGKFVLMLPVTLQVQDHSIPQQPPSTSFGASCYKNIWAKPWCGVTLPLGGKWEFWVQTLVSKGSNRYIVTKAKPATGIMKHQSLLLSNGGYIKRPRRNAQFKSCSSTPVHRALSSFCPLNLNFYHFGSITCTSTKILTLPRFFSTPKSREFLLVSRPNRSWAQPSSNALHTLEVIQYLPYSQRFSIGFTKFQIRALKMFSCFFSPQLSRSQNHLACSFTRGSWWKVR